MKRYTSSFALIFLLFSLSCFGGTMHPIHSQQIPSLTILASRQISQTDLNVEDEANLDVENKAKKLFTDAQARFNQSCENIKACMAKSDRLFAELEARLKNLEALCHQSNIIDYPAEPEAPTASSSSPQPTRLPEYAKAISTVNASEVPSISVKKDSQGKGRIRPEDENKFDWEFQRENALDDTLKQFQKQAEERAQEEEDFQLALQLSLES